MSVSVGEVFTGIKFVRSVVSQVKDNREELLRLSDRLQHILLTLEDSKQKDLLRSDEYNDALTAISSLVERAQRVTQKQLKRSLGARTWSRNDIATEIKRIYSDVDTYLSAHTIRTLDMMHVASAQQLTSLSSNVEEVMVKLAEIDLRLKTPPGPKWAPSIFSRAQENVRKLDNTQENVVLAATIADNTPDPNDKLLPKTLAPQDKNSQMKCVRSLAGAGRTSVQISSLQPEEKSLKSILRNIKPSTLLGKRSVDNKQNVITISGININASYEDVQRTIKSNGYVVPERFTEDPLLVTVTDDVSEFDATTLGGLQIAKSMPLIWWWNKYNAYHGLAPATTPGHTLVSLGEDGSIETTNIKLSFHQTLRVPDSHESNMLPPNLGCFPLVPVAQYAHKLPDAIREKGGFIMPMFQREALWISFHQGGLRRNGPAIKVSVGGVNAITGVAKDGPTPPDVEQDYVVAGLQPWLDGVVTDSGSVRQFVAMSHGKNYTVEEQVTGKAKHGGFQFDIFPRRPEPSIGSGFYIGDDNRHLEIHMTPAELDLPLGSTLKIPQVTSESHSRNWRLSDYKRRTNRSGHLRAVYSELPQRSIPVRKRRIGIGASMLTSPEIPESAQWLCAPTSPFMVVVSQDAGLVPTSAVAPTIISMPSIIPNPPCPKQGSVPSLSSWLEPSPTSVHASLCSLVNESVDGTQPEPIQDEISATDSVESDMLPTERIKSGRTNTNDHHLQQRLLKNIKSLGLSPGGKIEQRIYRDPVSPRMYDEENGHRFHVHILSPEDWEIVTGVLPPITPITAEIYKSYNIPWFSMSDQHVPSLDTPPSALSNIQSVAQLDEAKNFQESEPIDPNRPPMCALHLRTTATCVFRPCSHTACSACLGASLLKRSHCPKCAVKIDRFVGMKEPVAQVAETAGDGGGGGGDETAWDVLLIEDLARQAVDSKNISIIHLETDRVSALHHRDFVE